MKDYFREFVDNLENQSADAGDLSVHPKPEHIMVPEQNSRIIARLAVYDSLRAAPRVHNLDADDYDGFINLLANKTYQSSKELGGHMPYTVIREIIENLIHAYFKEVVISVLDNGNTIRISDQGPGIKNKEKAFEPGFSTATKLMKQHIKGVGSGLPITKETVSFLGGALLIEDNLNSGTVITIKVPDDKAQPQESEPVDVKSTRLELNKRQKQVLFLVMELGPVGPSAVASELGYSLSTAYRDLIYLEDNRLIYSDEQGKRVLTSLGIEYLDDLIGS